MRVFMLFLLLLLSAQGAYAQENEQVYVKGKHYLDLNIHSLDKYAKRLERTQKQLLGKLKRKEQKLGRQLMRKDSAAYARFKESPLTFDSIARLAAHPDSATLAARALQSGNKTIDTLKRVYGFVQSKATTALGKVSGLAGNAGLSGYSSDLNDLQGRLSYDQYITSLTTQRTGSLEGIAGNNSTVTGMQKELYYAKSKIAEWKKLADDPSKAEDLALEYLKGTKGFKLDGNSIGSPAGGNGQMPSGNMSADDLEKAGFQTKRMVTSALQQKYGASLGAVQEKLGGTVDQWSGEAQSLRGQINETRQSIAGLRNTEKPKFRINPMRGLPFWKRIEKQYGFQTARSAINPDGTGKPAILTIATGIAYRQTPKLSIGIGLAGNLGLGQNWSNIRFSFQGLTGKTFVNWQWQYGMGFYGGYEITIKQSAFQNSTIENTTSVPSASVHDHGSYSEAILFGITKSYKINSKWNGCIQLLFDAWWQDKGLRSPIVLRFLNAQL